MKETLCGLKKEGTWDEIVGLGQRVTEGFEKHGLDKSSQFDEWDDWRPRTGEMLDESVKEKTAKQASIEKGSGEQSDSTPVDDLKTAKDEISAAKDEISNTPPEAKETVKNSFKYLLRALDTTGRQFLRTVEETVYKRVMPTMSPLYFDNELVSANISKGETQGEFIFEVNINDDSHREKVVEYVKSFSDEELHDVSPNEETITHVEIIEDSVSH